MNLNLLNQVKALINTYVLMRITNMNDNKWQSMQIKAHNLSMLFLVIKDKLQLILSMGYLITALSCVLSLYIHFFQSDSIFLLKPFINWGNYLLRPILLEHNYFYLFNFICWSLSGFLFTFSYFKYRR